MTYEIKFLFTMRAPGQGALWGFYAVIKNADGSGYVLKDRANKPRRFIKKLTAVRAAEEMIAKSSAKVAA